MLVCDMKGFHWSLKLLPNSYRWSKSKRPLCEMRALVLVGPANLKVWNITVPVFTDWWPKEDTDEQA